MRIHRAEVKLIRKDDTLERSHVHLKCVCIRAADGDHALPVCEQLVPALDRLQDGGVADELRKEGIERAVQFGGDHRLEFAQAVPELDAGVVAYIPGFPGNIRFLEGRRFRIPWDER